MVTSKRAYAKGSLPGMLLPMAPSMWWAPADPCLHRRPSNITGALGSISSHCSFPLGLRAPFLFGPPRIESLFLPVLWKSCNQIPLVFKVRFSGIPSSFVWYPGWESQNHHNTWRTSLLLLFSSLWVTHLAGMGFDFIMIVPFLPSHYSFFFVFEHGVSSFGGSQRPPVDGWSRASCNFGALSVGEECTSFCSAILNQKPGFCFYLFNINGSTIDILIVLAYIIIWVILYLYILWNYHHNV